MTAFDGNGSKVGVFFDSLGTDIQISLSDDPEDYQTAGDEFAGILTLQPSDILQIMQDLEVAYFLRTGYRPVWETMLVPVEPVPNTKEQNIAFRKEWDRRVEEGM